jgi:hypothetical protein
MYMRLFVRNHRIAKTYFDLDEASAGPCIGKLIREVVEPFCCGVVVLDDDRRLWLQLTGRKNVLQYIGSSVEILAEACRRWLAIPKEPNSIAEFEAWLRSVDKAYSAYEETYPFTFWGCEIGDCMEPLGNFKAR